MGVKAQVHEYFEAISTPSGVDGIPSVASRLVNDAIHQHKASVSLSTLDLYQHAG